MIDVNSATWKAISFQLTERLQSCREKNDRSLSEQETATVRGEIAAIKDLLSLPERLAAKDSNGDLGFETDSFQEPDSY